LHVLTCECIKSRTDSAKPQTVQRGPACFQCRSHVRRSAILWQIISVIWLLDLTVLGVI